MDTAAFKRNAFKTLDPKRVKEGVRASLRKKATVNLASSIAFAQEDASKLICELRPYVQGLVGITDEMRNKSRVTMGDLLRHTVNVAKILKVKVPSSQRKMKEIGTISAVLFDVERLSGELYEVYTDTLRGQPLNLDKAKIIVSPLLNNIFLLSWMLLKEPAANVMQAHIDRLIPLYPKDFFAAPPKKPAPAHLTKKDGAQADGTAPAQPKKKGPPKKAKKTDAPAPTETAATTAPAQTEAPKTENAAAAAS